MLEPIRDTSGKLLFKWDRDNRMIEVQRKNVISRFRVTDNGELRPVPAPDIGYGLQKRSYLY